MSRQRLEPGQKQTNKGATDRTAQPTAQITTQTHTNTQPNRQMPIPAVRAALVAAGTLAMRLAWQRHAEKRSMHVHAPARARIGARSVAHLPLRSQRSACRSSTRRASCSSCTFRFRPRFPARARAPPGAAHASALLHDGRRKGRRSGGFVRNGRLQPLS